MIKDLINDLKLAAIDAKSELKDVIHDTTTQMPNTVQDNFAKMDSQSIPQADLGYMSPGWNGQNQMTALKIDMIAEKINFVSEMIQQGLLAFDSIEAELMGYSRGQIPPQPQQLSTMASRIDTNQKQIFMGLQKLRELSVEIDRATDRLQGNSPSSNAGWGNKSIGGSW